MTRSGVFELISNDVKGFSVHAVNDLFEWFEHLLDLQKISFKPPKFNVKYVNKFSNKSIVKNRF